jgi:ATP-dependent Lhr-like helicase
LDSPLFQSRWRWNLNRSLIVLRFRNGRRNPPPIQRMESDDLMAAVFPQAAACQENVTGPIDIPDHVLVRQSIDDTLHEALDIDGITALLVRIESGALRVHCCDTTEASVLAHEIVTARAYAFLDDEEFQNRRTNAVHLRRGLAVDLASIGALDPAAIDAVHAEIVAVPTTPDDLHDLLHSLVFVAARDDWRPLWDALVERGRAQVIVADGSEMWCVAEAADDARAALAGDHVAATRMVRGHLESAGITTAADLARQTRLAHSTIAVALAALQNEGFAMQGQYRRSAGAGRGDPGTAGPGAVEWVARRLLARMHSYSRRSRRNQTKSASAQDFVRFLLRWQHLAPGTQLTGDRGLMSVIEQLQGFEAAAIAWEPELLARRLRHYEPTRLDQLCHDGAVAWLRLSPRPRADAEGPVAAPSKATPIAVVFRADLPWLVSAARDSATPSDPSLGATAEILETLRQRGATFSGDLATATRRLPDDIGRGLWDGVTRGLVMCDGFSAIRARVTSTPPPPNPRRMSRLGRNPRVQAGGAGRWSLVPSPDAAVDRNDLAEAVAEQLLNRWGIVFRDLAVRDSLRLPWRDIQWALRRLEDRGLVRGGRFVTGFNGEQYALPGATEQLDQIRKVPRTGERVVLNATDPLNLVGTIVPGLTIPAVRTNYVTYVDGLPSYAGSDPEGSRQPGEPVLQATRGSGESASIS